MEYKMSPVGSWRIGDQTPWYTVLDDPLVVTDENIDRYNGGVTEVLVGVVIVHVQDKTDGGTGARVFPSAEHEVKTSVPTIGETEHEEHAGRDGYPETEDQAPALEVTVEASDGPPTK